MLEAEILKFNWERLPSFADSSVLLPDRLRGLASACDGPHADAFRDRIELSILMDGTLSEACMAVASCLVAAFPDMCSAARIAALDLLAQIGSANVYGPESDYVGAINVDLCRKIVARGFKSYVAELKGSLPYGARLNCIDLVVVTGHAESSLRESAIAALESARKDPQLVSARQLINSSLAELRSDEAIGL